MIVIPTGNRRFRVTIGMFLERYAATKDRHIKSSIVNQVLDIIYEACPVGAFIKYKDDRWWSVDERSAREKVGAYFRDSLSGKYRSSAKAKIARRREKDRARRASLSTQGSAASGGTTASSTTNYSIARPSALESDETILTNNYQAQDPSTFADS